MSRDKKYSCSNFSPYFWENRKWQNSTAEMKTNGGRYENASSVLNIDSSICRRNTNYTEELKEKLKTYRGQS
jgi:hypothetical protein